MKPKIAVFLFNLGGPDSPAAIRPFLFNLFRDPFIITAPAFVRLMIAAIIVTFHLKKSIQTYAKIGGASPLLRQTRDLAGALERACAPMADVRCFIAMRHWHPLTREALEQAAAFAPDIIVRLPLYPQYSHTTTGSSFWAFDRDIASFSSLDKIPVRDIRSYPALQGWIDLLVQNAAHQAKDLATTHPDQPVRYLFSAHGLPEKHILRGDPYRTECERTAQALAAGLEKETGIAPDWALCFQSRLGPQQWTGPSLRAEMDRAVRDRVAVVIIPIAFVSEHVETLVELDHEAKEWADAGGIGFARVPTAQSHETFVCALAERIREAAQDLWLN